MEKLNMMSKDGVQENIEKIKELFPNAVTEVLRDGKPMLAVDFDVLKQEMSSVLIDDKEERYQFTWPDKKKSVLLANTPISATLRPCKEESVDFDDTENLYIEGDNLEVLKLLQETYLGKIKMIYIDPPYNTGNDFVYEDDFAMCSKEYAEVSGQYDEQGNRLFQNTESNGRFHTDWLNMIYPRLKLAKDLLSDDGVIFISIDDNEQANLKKLCDEVFGEDNFIAELIWELGTGTTAGHFTRGHEYLLCYARKKYNINNFDNYNNGEIIKHGALKKISYKNPASEITFPIGFEYEGENAEFEGELGGSEKEYILSGKMSFVDGKLSKPVTIKAGFAMKKQVEDFIAGKQVYDTKGQPVKRFYFNSKGILFYEKEKTIINPKTVLSNIANTKNGTSEVVELFGNKYFDFPKPVALIKYLLKLLTQNNDIIFDFFSGSATTAHAVMQLNAEDGGNRKFIMVQLPEACDEKSEAYKAGYKTICEIGKERIRRAGKKIKEESPLTTANLDTGFRVLKLDSSNMKPVYYKPEDYTQDLLSGLEDNIKEDRTPMDLLFQVMLELGKPLSAKIEEKVIAGKNVFIVNDDDFIACFDSNITEEVVKQIALMKPLFAVFRDSSMANDSVNTNFEQIFATYSPNTTRKVL